jgi:hypothetical protein
VEANICRAYKPTHVSNFSKWLCHCYLLIIVTQESIIYVYYIFQTCVYLPHLSSFGILHFSHLENNHFLSHKAEKRSERYKICTYMHLYRHDRWVAKIYTYMLCVGFLLLFVHCYKILDRNNLKEYGLILDQFQRFQPTDLGSI